MHLFSVIIACLLVVAPAARPTTNRATWSQGVDRICRHALLFEHQHELGTEQGARAVARDIRASTAGRLTRIAHLLAQPGRTILAARWLDDERRLANLYADSYLRIWLAIDAANTSAARQHLPAVVHRLVHRPDGLQAIAAGLEQKLRVPDCTGGENANVQA